jgi:hypothetical protein
MDVVAQWVRTSWTKQSRGVEAARRRAAVPVAFPLPEVTSPMVHAITFDERLVARTEVRHAEPRPDEVALSEEDGLLRVHLVPALPGGPPRRRRPPAVRLAAGQWLRWRINYRCPPLCCGEPHYQQDVLNLAYGRVSTNVFQGTPAHQVDERVALL